MALPRGIRNNNPLNIRKGNNWKGERPNQTDKEFEEFESMQMGLRAAFILLRNYMTATVADGSNVTPSKRLFLGGLPRSRTPPVPISAMCPIKLAYTNVRSYSLTTRIRCAESCRQWPTWRTA